MTSNDTSLSGRNGRASSEVKFMDPKHSLLQLKLRDGMQVGDLGCGSGHYALTAAHAVGPKGKVYAVDVQEDLLTRLKDDAKKRNLTNIEYIWGDIERKHGTNLHREVLDAIVVSNTCFQLENKNDAIKEMWRILKPGGKLLLVEWSGAHGGMGPAKEHVFEESAAEEAFIKGGFTKERGFEAGAHHYAIIFSRS